MPRLSLRRPAVSDRSRRSRLIAGLWLVVYAVFSVAAPIADGAVEHRTVAAHWDGGDSSGCPAQHDREACQLCQACGRHVVTPVAPVLTPVLVARVVSRTGLGERMRASDPDGLGAVGPRGPPTV